MARLSQDENLRTVLESRSNRALAKLPTLRSGGVASSLPGSLLMGPGLAVFGEAPESCRPGSLSLSLSPSLSLPLSPSLSPSLPLSPRHRLPAGQSPAGVEY